MQLLALALGLLLVSHAHGQTPLQRELQSVADQLPGDFAAAAQCDDLACSIEGVRRACSTLRRLDNLVLRQGGSGALADQIGEASANCALALAELERGNESGAVRYSTRMGQHFAEATALLERGGFAAAAGSDESTRSGAPTSARVVAPLVRTRTQPSVPAFRGCDLRMADVYDQTCSDWTVEIVKRGGVYYKDGREMVVGRHSNMPDYGLSLALKSRVGEPPDTYYLVTPRNLDIYTECEFGECRYRRSIENAECCDFVP